MPDGGYAHGIRKVTTAPAIEAESNSSTEPDSGVEEELGIEDVIRCICGMDEDGGTMMVQWYVL